MRARKILLIFYQFLECLTISSDEEEESRAKRKNVNNNAALNNVSNAFNEDADTILDKEPIITNSSVSTSYEEFSNDENSKGNIL